MNLSKIFFQISIIIIVFLFGNLNFYKGNFPHDEIRYLHQYYKNFIKSEEHKLFPKDKCEFFNNSNNSEKLKINKKNLSNFYKDKKIYFTITYCPFVYEYDVNKNQLKHIYLEENIIPYSLVKNSSDEINADYILLSNSSGFLRGNKILYVKNEKIQKNKKIKLHHWIHNKNNNYFASAREWERKKLSDVRGKNYPDCDIEFTANDKIEIYDMNFKKIYSKSVLDLLKNVKIDERVCSTNPIQLNDFYPDKNLEFALISSKTLSKVFYYDIKKEKILKSFNFGEQHSPRFINENQFVVFDNLGNKSEYGRSRIVLVDIDSKNYENLFEGSKDFYFDNEVRGKVDIDDEFNLRVTEKNSIFLLNCENLLNNSDENKNCNFFELFKTEENFQFTDSRIF